MAEIPSKTRVTALGAHKNMASLTTTAEPVSAEPRGIAPVWHTIVLLLLLGGTSAISAASSHSGAANNHIVSYVATMVWEFLLLAWAWWGMRLRRVTMREIIGGKWSSPEQVMLDIGLAIGFIIVSYFVIAGIIFGLGGNAQHQMAETKRIAAFIAPRTRLELGLAFLLSAVAGFVEEVLYRGYLQRQFAAWGRGIAAGIVLSGLAFGVSHGYEGIPRMVAIAVFGMMFGVMAYFRRSLRPGMIAHALFDAAQLLVLYFLSRGVLQVPQMPK